MGPLLKLVQVPLDHPVPQMCQLGVICELAEGALCFFSGLLNSKRDIVSTNNHKLDTLHKYSAILYEKTTSFGWNSFCKENGTFNKPKMCFTQAMLFPIT